MVLVGNKVLGNFNLHFFQIGNCAGMEGNAAILKRIFQLRIFCKRMHLHQEFVVFKNLFHQFMD